MSSIHSGINKLHKHSTSTVMKNATYHEVRVKYNRRFDYSVNSRMRHDLKHLLGFHYIFPGPYLVGLKPDDRYFNFESRIACRREDNHYRFDLIKVYPCSVYSSIYRKTRSYCVMSDSSEGNKAKRPYLFTQNRELYHEIKEDGDAIVSVRFLDRCISEVGPKWNLRKPGGTVHW